MIVYALSPAVISYHPENPSFLLLEGARVGKSTSPAYPASSYSLLPSPGILAFSFMDFQFFINSSEIEANYN
jgi:hypothetical protein